MKTINLKNAMNEYAITDKQRYPSYNGADNLLRPDTTFWADFCVAEAYGDSAINDTFNRAFAEWKDDVKYFTELAMVLNYKLWTHYENGNDDVARLYDSLWKKASAHAYDNFKGEDAMYYFSVTD